MSFENLSLEQLTSTYVMPWGIRIILALAVFVIGRWVAKALVRAMRKLLARSSMDEMLIKFLGNIAYTLLLAVVVLAALEQLGVNTTSALAILGAAGLAVGLALKDSLGNFASGVMLIIFRPFNTGDFVEAGGITGVIEEITVFSTILRTGDNKKVIVPNGQIASGTIINYSAKPTRRIDLVFGIGYEDDLRKAKELIEQAMRSHDRILKDPEPVIMLLELADSSVNIAARPWVDSDDYWAVRADLLENVKAAFDANGISIPYPQQDVHMHEVKPAA